MGTCAKIRVPEVYGVFRDEEKPDEYFCIAMEDMCAEFDLCEGVSGISFATAKELVSVAAKLHGTFYKGGAGEGQTDGQDWMVAESADGHWDALWCNYR